MTRRWMDLLAFVEAHPNSTELEIARGVGLKKTPYTRQILLALVADGRLVRWWDDGRLPAAYCYYAQQTAPLE